MSKLKYIYGKNGNLIVECENGAAKCPVEGCEWIEHDDRVLLSKLTAHIKIEHQMDYSSLDMRAIDPICEQHQLE